MNWYVLFVKAGQEQKVESFLKRCLDTKVFIPFIPLQQTLFKFSGTMKKEVRPLFPGYVFIKSQISDQEFVNHINTFIYNSQNSIRLLRYSDTEFAMRQREKSILLSLCNDDHCIEISRGIKVGNKINILEGPLKGYESIVKKVNRHKRQALIEIDIMGDIRLVRVALEVVERV